MFQYEHAVRAHGYPPRERLAAASRLLGRELRVNVVISGGLGGSLSFTRRTGASAVIPAVLSDRIRHVYAAGGPGKNFTGFVTRYAPS